MPHRPQGRVRGIGVHQQRAIGMAAWIQSERVAITMIGKPGYCVRSQVRQRSCFRRRGDWPFSA